MGDTSDGIPEIKSKCFKKSESGSEEIYATVEKWRIGMGLEIDQLSTVNWINKWILNEKNHMYIIKRLPIYEKIAAFFSFPWS